MKSKHIIRMWCMHYVKVLEFEEKSLGVLLCVLVRVSLATPGQQKKMERAENKCGCLAHILFKVDNGVHEVM